ncbi:MAG: MoaD/ThiS family protein [Chloroflexi bacterium]|nr:MoaD/ThiS family protein [Chloroflexota bacterium]
MRIRTYATLRDLMGVSAIDLPLAERTTIGYVLHRLVESYPALGHKLWDAGGASTGFVTVLLNGRSVEYLKGQETPVADDDTISLFPPVGGG